MSPRKSKSKRKFQTSKVPVPAPALMSTSTSMKILTLTSMSMSLKTELPERPTTVNTQLRNAQTICEWPWRRMALIISRNSREAKVQKEIETEEDQPFTCLFVCWFSSHYSRVNSKLLLPTTLTIFLHWKRNSKESSKLPEAKRVNTICLSLDVLNKLFCYFAKERSRNAFNIFLVRMKTPTRKRHTWKNQLTFTTNGRLSWKMVLLKLTQLTQMCKWWKSKPQFRVRRIGLTAV